MNLSGPQLVIGGTVLVSSLLFQIFHQFHLLLFALGLVSSAICGSLLYLSLRLKFSPPANLGNCHVPKEVLQVNTKYEVVLLLSSILLIEKKKSDY